MDVPIHLLLQWAYGLMALSKAAQAVSGFELRAQLW